MKYSRLMSYHNDKIKCTHDGTLYSAHLLTGGKFPTAQTYKVVVEATATDQKFIENCKKIKLDQVPSVELFSFFINYCDQTKHFVDNSAELSSFAQTCYDKIKTLLYLSSKPHLDVENNTVSKVYKAIDPQLIIKLKNDFVDFFEKKLGKTDVSIIKSTDGNIYHVFSQNGSDLFAIHDKYCSINQWCPKLKLGSEQGELTKHAALKFADNILMGLYFDKVCAKITKN